MGYLVRECRDVNDDFAIFKKVSAWFFRAEMKSPELIFISSKTILFPLITSLIWADSEVYRVRKTLIGKLLGNAIFVFWNIGYFQKRSTSSIIKWNGSVLNLNHSSIPQTKICQIDTSLLSFALFMSKINLPLLGALISANLRLPTLASANFLCFLYFDVQL